MKRLGSICVPAVIFSLLVWAVSFMAIASQGRLYDSDQNQYVWFLNHTFSDAIQADEELIFLVGSSAWSLLLGTFVAAIRVPKSTRPKLAILWGSAIVELALVFLGAEVIRHWFHGSGALAFHILFFNRTRVWLRLGIAKV